MRYYIDTEFIESFHKPLFGKKRHFIDLISIGIKAEDGREYYAVSNEFNPKDASDWVKQNVIEPICIDLFKKLPSDVKSRVNYNEKELIRQLGKSNKQIAREIIEFINPYLGWHVSSYNNSELKEGGRLDKHFTAHNVEAFDNYYFAQPEFYGYYADYDWVLFCSLFGTMMDLPKGFPMYCVDLKQTLDDVANSKAKSDILKYLNQEGLDSVLRMRLSGEELSKAELLKMTVDYPKIKNEHNALSDARFNFDLHNFLKSL